MFENPRRGRQAKNFTTNVPKILVLKSSSEQIFSRKLPLGAPDGLRVLHSNIRPILFEFCDPQCVHSIQYGTTLHFNTGKNQKDNASVVGHARLFCITRELRTQISLNYSIARCAWTGLWTGLDQNLDWTGLDCV